MSIASVTPNRALKPRPDYGIDSPGIITEEAVLGTTALLCAVLFPRLRWLEILVGVEFRALALSMLAYSKAGKMRIRDRILDAIPWRGDERVLDVGCGRGLVLIGAARRVPRGSAVGVDTWVPGALTGNGVEAVPRNAVAEGAVVEVREGDARCLAFPDATFDVVVSNFVVHEVNTSEGRLQMLGEIVRMLRPGGRLALVDFIFTRECVDVLRRLGVGNAGRTRIGGWSAGLARVLLFGTFQIHLVTGAKSGPATPDDS